jgi:hypothetical protein
MLQWPDQRFVPVRTKSQLSITPLLDVYAAIPFIAISSHIGFERKAGLPVYRP